MACRVAAVGEGTQAQLAPDCGCCTFSSSIFAIRSSVKSGAAAIPSSPATRPGRARERDRRREHRALATQKKKDGTPNREMSKKGSKRRRKAVKRMRRAETKIACQRRTRAAQAAACIVAKSDGVALERAKNLAGLYRTPN